MGFPPCPEAGDWFPNVLSDHHQGALLIGVASHAPSRRRCWAAGAAHGLLRTKSRALPDRDATTDARPKVLTTFTILADMAGNVAGDRLQVESITKPGAEIHGYEFTPSDIERASGADLIVENGLGLELWAKRFTAAAGEVPTVTLTDGIQPLLIEEDAYAGRPNPHAWMSPMTAQHYVDQLVLAFSELDPEGAEAYQSNGEAYKASLRSLDAELRQSLASLPESQRLLVSCEGALSYLARDYGSARGLSLAGQCGKPDHATPDGQADRSRQAGSSASGVLRNHSERSAATRSRPSRRKSVWWQFLCRFLVR